LAWSFLYLKALSISLNQLRKLFVSIRTRIKRGILLSQRATKRTQVRPTIILDRRIKGMAKKIFDVRFIIYWYRLIFRFAGRQ